MVWFWRRRRGIKAIEDGFGAIEQIWQFRPKSQGFIGDRADLSQKPPLILRPFGSEITGDGPHIGVGVELPPDAFRHAHGFLQ